MSLITPLSPEQSLANEVMGLPVSLSPSSLVILKPFEMEVRESIAQSM
jgi:hypothetical protein